MVKKILAVAVVTVVLAGVAVLTTQHYRENKQQTKQHEVAVTQTAVAKEQASASAERAKLVASYNQLQAECTKGKLAYDKLPTYLQKAVPAPQCPSVLQ